MPADTFLHGLRLYRNKLTVKRWYFCTRGLCPNTAEDGDRLMSDGPTVESSPPHPSSNDWRLISFGCCCHHCHWCPPHGICHRQDDGNSASMTTNDYYGSSRHLRHNWQRWVKAATNTDDETANQCQDVVTRRRRRLTTRREDNLVRHSIILCAKEESYSICDATTYKKSGIIYSVLLNIL